MNVTRRMIPVFLGMALVASWGGPTLAQQRSGATPAQGSPYDSALRRVQAPAGDITATPRPFGEPDIASPPPPVPEGSVPEATTPSFTGNPPTNETDLGIPRAEKEGEPTTAEAAEEAPEDETDDTKLLMKFLNREDSKVKVYGWIQNSFTGNANGNFGGRTNFGVNPNNLANKWMGNQYYLIFEKPVEQNDEINFGFRFDNLFGNDAQFNHAHGIFDRAFKPNYFSQYDPAQYYAEVHLPWFTEGGLDIKGGRFYTLAGYEVVPATGRPLLSVPYMFNYGQPFTHSGMVSTLHLTDKINIYNGIINGWDRQFDKRLTWGYIGGFAWTSQDDKTTLATTFISGPNQFPIFLPAGQNPLYPTGVVPPPAQFAGKRNPGYNSNQRFLFTTVLTHKWSDKLTQVLEVDQAWETNVPFALGNNDGFNRQNAQWYGFGNWFLYTFNEKLTGVWRSEIFRDNNGVRTGFSGNFSEFTLGLIYKPKSYLWVRPEARYDFANEAIPYNGGTRTSQLTLGFDIILLF